jgi:hypothetical protein
MSFTQQQLVQNLYLYDVENFKSLVETTLSKWERNSITPPIHKQISILKYFQEKTGVALPCFDTYSMQETEKLISISNMQDIFRTSKELVLNFPSEMTNSDNLTVNILRDAQSIDKIININMDMDKTFNHNNSQLTSEQFKEWALHDSNSFYVCKYNDQFFGLLFTLRLKIDSFEKIMNFKTDEKNLSVEDFATFDEKGSNYIISFFAMNDKAASILFTRYYAHIIAHQKNIDEIGAITMMSDAKKLLTNINLNYYSSKVIDNTLKLRSYRETLTKFLASEIFMKIIFSANEFESN